MAKPKTEHAPEEEILVLHEKWVKAAREHLREIIIACLVLVFLASLWAFYGYYRQKKLNDASLLYAQALMVRDHQKRLELLEEVVKRYGSTSAGLEARLTLFENFLQKGELGKAFNELDKAYKKAKEPLKTFVTLGRGYLLEDQEKFAQAEKHYQKVAKAELGLEKIAYLDLARVAELEGKYDQAVQYYRQAVALKPSPAKLDFIQVKLDRLTEKIGERGQS